jgi:hypothetical protein
MSSVMLKVNSPLGGGERGDQYLVAARASRKAGNNAAPSMDKTTWVSRMLRRLNVKCCSYYALSKRSLSDMSAPAAMAIGSPEFPSCERRLTHA